MRWLWAVVVALLAFPAAVPAQNLKLVPQTVGIGAFDAAGWSPDGRWLLTASGHERLVRIWDPASGVIVDTVRLPLPGKRADEKLVLDGVTVAADGRRARVEAVLVAENNAIGDMQYQTIDFDVNLVTRQAIIVPTTRDLEKPTTYIPGAGAVPDIDAGLPVLPAAPDGRRLQRAEGNVLRLLDAGGGLIRALSGEKPVMTDWVSMSPDGAMALFVSPGDTEDLATLVMAQDAGEAPHTGPVTRISLFDIATGEYAQPELVAGRYGRVGWLGRHRLVMSEESTPFGRNALHYPDHKGVPSDGLIVNLAGKGGEPLVVEARCYLQPLGSGGLVGAGLANCRHGAGKDRGIWVADLTGAWRRLPVKLPAGATVDGLRASPDGTLIALGIGVKDAAKSVLLIDAATGQEMAGLDADGPPVTALQFLPDGRSLVVMGSRMAVHWRFADDVVDELKTTDADPSMMVSDGQQLLIGGVMSPLVQRVRLADGTAVAPVDVVGPLTGGFLPEKSIFWVGTADGELRLFDSRDLKPLATLMRFRDGQEEYFLVRDAAGRYDSNLQPDYAPFQWLVAEAPFQSLAPQTFMRELYTPDLLARLMECSGARRCDAVLPAAPDVGALNRTLPVVARLEVTPGTGAGLVDVAVTVLDGVNARPSGAYDRALSGMHNLRLFRDEVLVAEAGAVPAGLDPADRAGWRAATKLVPNRADGAHVAMFRGVRLPTGPRDAPLRFSAYAFNEDRMRGEEVATELALPADARPARPRRLLLLSIGVDAYPGGTFRPLRYAVADARAMAEVFAHAFVHPQEPRPMAVVPMRVEGTAADPATRAKIAAAFVQLKAATPDDIVVISFSGHGYTDARGRFSLVPSDVRTAGDLPDGGTMISAEDLARWLMPVDAGAIHLIIDACHSAASVQSGGFKPGPMGDAGLGQLAYDKGIRILSASAPDQYAMEDRRMGHGLLTYALVVEGARGGRADADADGLVTLDELMAYAVARLPAMDAPALADPLDGPGMVVEWAGPQVARQTPKLFDFAADYSPLAVRPQP